MTVGIVANKHKDYGLAYTREITRFLEARGALVVPIEVTAAESTTIESTTTEAIGDNVLPRADFWVVLGGDGTMLKAAHNAAVLDIPLLGINLGTMGFLTDVDRQDGFTAIENVLEGRYESQKRLMLEARLVSNVPSLALNEVLVCSATGGLEYFSVYVNDMHMDDIRANGIIVATPTGSTAYNLSAGGPILAPYGQMMVVTAVCPHSLSTRPWVISAQDKVRIALDGAAKSTADLVPDGEKLARLQPGDYAEIRRADVSATIIKTTPAHFYEVLRKKKIL